MSRIEAELVVNGVELTPFVVLVGIGAILVSPDSRVTYVSL